MIYDKNFVDHVYDIIKLESDGLDAVYKDFIIHNVGVFGFNALFVHKLIESCGVINGRHLYALCDKR